MSTDPEDDPVIAILVRLDTALHALVDARRIAGQHPGPVIASIGYQLDDALEVVEHRLKPIVFPLLKGHSAAFQGVVLGYLTAIWLAGHFVKGDLAATRKMRDELLDNHICAIEELVDLSAAMIGTPFEADK
jgi:hypothetical protein